MQNTAIDHTAERGSMRRTVLTLLGALAAFGVLTASYATTDLQPVESAQASSVTPDTDLR